MADNTREFIPVRIAVMTVSDTRTRANDTSGDTLEARVKDAGHSIVDRVIVPDEKDVIVAQLKKWIADPGVDAVISTGGTGLTGRDVTPEAFRSVFEKEIDGFSGSANGTYLFALPGSPGAVKDGWDAILKLQLDYRNKPCNFVEIMPRLQEHQRRKS
jgi:molybdopterin adenylyltransferase